MILALETATRACSAALFGDDRSLVAEALALDGPAHSQRLLSGVHAVLGDAGVGLGDVETVVVGLGPGAFTGLRIGVATARGLAQAAGLRLGGVPTLAALALALAGGEAGAGAALCVPLVDGRRGEVFVARYRRRAAAADRSGVAASCLVAEAGLEVIKADDLAAYFDVLTLAGAVVVTGGDGAVLHADRLPAAVVQDGAVAAPTAAMIGRAWLAAVPGVVEGFADVLPLYGRRPDARPAAARATR